MPEQTTTLFNKTEIELIFEMEKYLMALKVEGFAVDTKITYKSHYLLGKIQFRTFNWGIMYPYSSRGYKIAGGLSWG